MKQTLPSFCSRLIQALPASFPVVMEYSSRRLGAESSRNFPPTEYRSRGVTLKVILVIRNLHRK